MSREAFEKWAQGKSLLINIREEMMYAAGYINVKEMAWEAFCAGWQAALQSGEPVAWMSPNKQSLEFSRPDTVYGSHTIPLYTNPQPVVDAVVFDMLKAAQGSCKLGLKGYANKYIQNAIDLLSAGKGGGE
jgi:hypothetical protein